MNEESVYDDKASWLIRKMAMAIGRSHDAMSGAKPGRRLKVPIYPLVILFILVTI